MYKVMNPFSGIMSELVRGLRSIGYDGCYCTEPDTYAKALETYSAYWQKQNKKQYNVETGQPVRFPFFVYKRNAITPVLPLKQPLIDYDEDYHIVPSTTTLSFTVYFTNPKDLEDFEVLYNSKLVFSNTKEIKYAEVKELGDEYVATLRWLPIKEQDLISVNPVYSSCSFQCQVEMSTFVYDEEIESRVIEEIIFVLDTEDNPEVYLDQYIKPNKPMLNSREIDYTALAPMEEVEIYTLGVYQDEDGVQHQKSVEIVKHPDTNKIEFTFDGQLSYIHVRYFYMNIACGYSRIDI